MTRTLLRLIVGVLTAALSTVSALGFEPPEDVAGPLAVRIEGPAEVTRLGVPVPMRVVLENRGDAPLQGTLELALIDRWTAAPTGPVAFSVAGRATRRVEFTVTAGAGTFAALYPIHAYARFAVGDQRWTAHPILIVQAKPSEVPRPESAGLSWEAFDVPETGVLALWPLPTSRAIVQVFGQKAVTRSVGWRGSDEATGTSIGVRAQVLDEKRREVLAIHPPWRDGQIGTAAVEFPLSLPDVRPITLRFQNAVTPDGNGDGVTFRVRVLPLDAPEGELGEVVFEQHSAAKAWGDEATADLSRFAGRSIRLQLESHPGPKNNTNFDQSYWAEPTLVMGTPTPPAPFPPADLAGSEPLGTVRYGERGAEVRVWPGRRGLLDTVLGLLCGETPIYVQGFAVRVQGSQLDDPRSPIVLTDIEVDREGKSYRVRHRFRGPRGAFTLVGELAVESGVLRARFRLEDMPAPRAWQATYLEDVSLGSWSLPARQVYAGHGNVVREPGPFVLNYDGHRLSTSFVGIDFQDGPSVVEGVDVPPLAFEVRPEEQHYALHTPHAQTITLVPAENAFEGAKVWREVNGLKPAGGVSEAAGRFVFDLWGGRYGESATALRRSFRYGLGDSMVIWHNWQRWGYDYRLPEIIPPNPKLGTFEEMKDLIAACKESGTRFALHDNYIDFYPDAEGFSYDREIAFHADGRPVMAWLNEGRGAQSYRYRADRIEPYLKPNLAWIKQHLAPTAYFIDVWSSAPPYDYWTADGRFFDRLYTRQVWGTLFAWIRETLGDSAPQISESGHDGLIGWLDGAQTNHLRVGPRVPGSRHAWTWDWPSADAERTPWFDVAHHDRFILHGAGYPSRYEGGLDRRLHGIFSDDYMATEVLTGHPAMVSEPFSQNVVRKYWLLNDLMRALALRTIESVEFVADDLHRQYVRWSGGGEVRVNRGESDWQVGGRTLPPFGFYARVPVEGETVEASISRRDGLIVEEARAPGYVYANARGLVDGPARIRPEVAEFRPIGERDFTLALNWQADDPIPTNYRPFLHFCDDRGEIVFQAGQDPAAFAGSRQGAIRAIARGSVPEDIKPGETFTLRAGLYDPRGGPRLRLSGPDDGELRIRLGTLRVGGEGDRVTGLSWEPYEAPADPVLARQNPDARPVDFGTVTTAGGVRLTHVDESIVVTPLPNERGQAFEVTLRPAALGWSVTAPTHAEAIAEDGTALGRELLRLAGTGADATVSLNCQPGVFQYRLIRPR